MSDSLLTSKLIFGTASLSSHPSVQRALRILQEAYELGITHFDTAPVYGKGYAEAIVGKFISSKRDKILVTTKFGIGEDYRIKLDPFLALPLNYLSKKIRSPKIDLTRREQEVYPVRSISKETVSLHLEGSLRRLKTDYLDYYLLHEGIPDFLTEQAKEFLVEKKYQGVLRHLGVAANRKNTELLTSEQLSFCDVIQYDSNAEKGIIHFANNGKHIQHFHHSIFDDSIGRPMAFDKSKFHGYILAEAVRNNPLGKVIFTTRKSKRLKQNIQAYKEFSSQLSY